MLPEMLLEVMLEFQVREETNKRRLALAEQHTTYNRPSKEE